VNIAMPTKKDIADYASMAAGVAKTFFNPNQSEDKQVRPGPGPAPPVKQLKPPTDYHTAYGAYAPRGLAANRKVGTKGKGKGRRKRASGKKGN
jgi:hypothetical protein